MQNETSPGVVISRARQRKGWTQQQLADALGVYQVTVARWETDVHFPLRHAGAIEEVLGIVIPAPAQS